MVDMNASDYRLLILSPMHENLASWNLKFAKSGTVSRSSSCELAFKFLVNTSAPGRDFRVDVRYHLYHSMSSVAFDNEPSNLCHCASCYATINVILKAPTKSNILCIK